MAAIRRNSTLSEDLISEILVRLPVKSLLRFQSVCKTWLSLIKDPAFVKSQLRYAVTTQTDQTLIISRYKGYKENKFSLLHVDSLEIVADLKFPYSRDEFKSTPNITLVGSANGIVCVAVDFPKYKTSIYLWNPAVRQSKLIPSYSNVFINESLGFGYDPIDHDFKVVRVVRSEYPTSFCAEVYSDNRNTWGKVPDPIDIPYTNHFYVCVNGFLCTIGEYGMVTFDLNKEVLNCAIKLPVISDDDDAHIIEFNNSVAVIIMINKLNFVDADCRLDEKINIWTLSDDACLRGGGVEALWMPMFRIDIFAAADPDMAAMIIHGYFSKRDLLLLIINEINEHAWISCDVYKKEAKIVPLSVNMADNHYTRDIYKYTESLVSLAGFKQVKWNAREDNN